MSGRDQGDEATCFFHIGTSPTEPPPGGVCACRPKWSPAAQPDEWSAEDKAAAAVLRARLLNAPAQPVRRAEAVS